MYIMKDSNWVFEIFAILLTIYVIGAFHIIVNVEIITPVYMVISFIYLALLLSLVNFNRMIDKVAVIYCVALLIGFSCHKMKGLDDKLFGDIILRISPILLIMYFSYRKAKPSSFLSYFVLSFFVLECIIAIYERMTLTHLLNYPLRTQAMVANMDFTESFRSFSLMGHPLRNSFVVLIMLAFIVCSSYIPKKMKLLLAVLGLSAIWATNSRMSMIIGACIVFYRFLLYEKNWKWSILAIFLIFTIVPVAITFIEKTQILGRLNLDFSDSSAMARIVAYYIFANHDWSFSEILFGGTVLEYPYFYFVNAPQKHVVLENSILMILGYWGFIIGPIIILGEIAITYLALWRYNMKDKIIIMVAVWIGALMSPATYTATYIITFFMISNYAFAEKYQLNFKKEAYVKLQNILNKRLNSV